MPESTVHVHVTEKIIGAQSAIVHGGQNRTTSRSPLWAPNFQGQRIKETHTTHHSCDAIAPVIHVIMKRCERGQWLSLVAQGGAPILQETGRLQALLDCFSDTNSCSPSLVALVGSKTKTLLIRELIPTERKHRFKSRKIHTAINLHLDSSTAFDEKPVFYADCPLPLPLLNEDSPQAERCHENIKRPLQVVGEELSVADISDYLYSRLLRPFTDMFCLFSEDLGGIEGTVKCLASWLDRGLSVVAPKGVEPKIVLVITDHKAGKAVESAVKQEILHTLKRLTSTSVFDFFSDVDVVSILPQGQVSPQARFRPLKDRLMNSANQIRIRKSDVGLLFSVTHFVAFFRYASDHFASTFSEPFDFVKVSRRRNPVPAVAEMQICRFLRHFGPGSDATDVAIPVIASTLLLDAYPPDMHCKS